MFYHKNKIPVKKKTPHINDKSKLVINISPYVSEFSNIIKYNYDNYDNLTYIPQDTKTLTMLLNGDSKQPKNQDSFRHNKKINWSSLHFYNPQYINIFIIPYTDLLSIFLSIFNLKIHIFSPSPKLRFL
jgi:hypothetical protein